MRSAESVAEHTSLLFLGSTLTAFRHTLYRVSVCPQGLILLAKKGSNEVIVWFGLAAQSRRKGLPRQDLCKLGRPVN